MKDFDASRLVQLTEEQMCWVREHQDTARIVNQSSHDPTKPAPKLSKSRKKEPSPIELNLLTWLILEAVNKHDNLIVKDGKCDLVNIQCHGARYEMTVRREVPVGPFFVDYLLSMRAVGSDSQCQVVVECDGHEFHEKTKEQVEADKSRERKIVAAGFQLLRFAGSEIWRDSQKCCREIREYLTDKLSLEQHANTPAGGYGLDSEF